MGPIGCPETSANANLRRVTSQKSEDLILTVVVHAPISALYRIGNGCVLLNRV